MDMVAQDLTQGSLQQMGRGVVAADRHGSVQDILVGSTHGDDEVLGLLAGIAVHGDDAADHRHTGSQILAEAGHTGHVHDDGAGSGGQAAVRDLAAQALLNEDELCAGAVDAGQGLSLISGRSGFIAK